MPKDWLEWHDLYNTEPKLQQRLQILREYISHSLDASPPGIIRVVSVCTGDGRDLLGTLASHPRSKDAHARLLESLSLGNPSSMVLAILNTLDGREESVQHKSKSLPDHHYANSRGSMKAPKYESQEIK